MTLTALLISAAAILTCIPWLGAEPVSPLVRTLLRPAMLALSATLVLLLAADQPMRWPYALSAAASLLGIWECFAGVYRLLGTGGTARTPVRQIQVCTLWLATAVANLALLNVAAHLAIPGTFEWRGREASIMDIVYFTLLSFASSGYGDVLPGNSLGKMLAMVASSAGLAYATIIFAALLDSLRQHR